MLDANDVKQRGGRLDPWVDSEALGLPQKPQNPQNQDSDPWAPPMPFARYQVPSFPVEVLPRWVRDYVEAVAVSFQVPHDLPAMLVLAVGGAVAAKAYEVEVKSGWTEPTNIYVVVAMPPASRKSPVFNVVAKPIYRREAQLCEEAGPAVSEIRVRRQILEGKLKAAVQAARKDEGQSSEAVKIQQELDALPRVSPPRLVCDDVTPEELINLMGDNGERIALMSAEGGVFNMMAGRYSKNAAPDLAVYLKAHCGDPIRVDRVTRQGVGLDAPALTIGITVQPKVIEGLASQGPEFRGLGLLARFAYSIPPSLIGYRDVDPPPVPASVGAAYTTRMQALLKRCSPVPAATSRLGLTPEAGKRLVRFDADVEKRFLDPGSLAPIPDWGGKLVGLVCRIAGILHVLNAIDEERPEETAVSLRTVQAAIAIGDYLQPHAQVAFAMMGADPAVEAAKHILAWLRRKPCARFTRRDCFDKTRGEHYRVVKEMEPALAVLEEHAYIRREPREEGKVGRPSAAFEVNPLFLRRLTSAGSAGSAGERRAQ